MNKRLSLPFLFVLGLLCLAVVNQARAAVVQPATTAALGRSLASAQALPAAITPLTNIVQLAAGGSHTCALTTAGGVMCWGSNDYGQLGDGSTEIRVTPVAVIGLSASISAISVGDAHTCALTSAGGVMCWGSNDYGQLGDGKRGYSVKPVDVVGLSVDVSAISAGEGHTCALSAAGGVQCWGFNDYGQLGDGSTERRATPVDVVGLNAGVSAISAGRLHTCALTTAGGVQCWGENGTGQLGDGSTERKATPVGVVGLSNGVSAISAGESHTCALTMAGGVRCWGRNDVGELGDGSRANRVTPVDVVGLSNGISAISADGGHTCALTTMDGVHCWGANSFGELGDSSTVDRVTPVDVVGLSNGVNAISTGIYHTCALMTAGSVQCWGNNTFGQLGDGNSAEKFTPVAVVGLSAGVSAISAGDSHTCALTTTNGIHCWGTNSFGELGDGSAELKFTPVDVVGLSTGVSAISTGFNHTCALTTAGGVQCWGYNNEGQLGDGSAEPKFTPVDVIGLSASVSAISAGFNHTCALTTAGGVQCWGSNAFGQLGDGSSTGVSAISAGESHTCALTLAGGVQCWGSNSFGQLGDGSTADRGAPVDVVGLSSGVSAISAGGSHTCALTTAGGLMCWGRNNFGQLGDGSKVDRVTPVDVVGLSAGVSTLNAGFNHTCALTTAGGVQCWGRNNFGQLGDGSTVDRVMPVDVVGLSAGISATSAGDSHTCAVTTAGGVMCWGWNGSGQLGDGSPWSTVPVDVVIELLDHMVYLPLVVR